MFLILFSCGTKRTKRLKQSKEFYKEQAVLVLFIVGKQMHILFKQIRAKTFHFVM